MVTLARALLHPDGGTATLQASAIKSLSTCSCSDSILTKQPSYYGFISHVGVPTGRESVDHTLWSIFVSAIVISHHKSINQN